MTCYFMVKKTQIFLEYFFYLSAIGQFSEKRLRIIIFGRLANGVYKSAENQSDVILYVFQHDDRICRHCNVCGKRDCRCFFIVVILIERIDIKCSGATDGDFLCIRRFVH